jgi:prepilin-type N-terminal cleavage/methylation domain-containing protein
MRGRMQPSMTRQRRAFTLLELIVVIGIIALLFAIFLPAMEKVQHKGYIDACASNLHRLALDTSAHHPSPNRRTRSARGAPYRRSDFIALASVAILAATDRMISESRGDIRHAK